MVEGDEKERSLLSRTLLHFGFAVRSVATAAEAASLLGSTHHCVIIDMLLPDEAGIALLRAFRARRHGLKIAAVLPTHIDASLNIKVNSLTPDASFRKPVNALEVVAWVRTLLP